jgi:cytidine deaminase
MITVPLALEELFERARQAQKNAYAPYTKRNSGAAIVTKDGTVFTGATLEIANWTNICAAHIAVANAVSSGKRDLLALAIYPTSYPCGVCRQIMMEFNPDFIVVFERDGQLQQTTLNEILPNSFGPWNVPGRPAG